MDSFAFVLRPELAPFAVALGIVAALCAVEILATLAGSSLIGLGGEADAADVDIDPDLGAEAEAAAPGPTGALLSWLGLGTVPFVIWLAGVLTSFALAGYALQLGASAVTGAPVGAWPAAALALVPGLALGGRLARAIGRLVPKTETTAISTRAYGGRVGVVTVGTARHGHPAQARFRDGHGNTHYAVVEPLHEDDALPEGTEIAIVRLSDGRLRAVRLDENAP